MTFGEYVRTARERIRSRSVAARKLKQGEGVLADNDPDSPAVVQKVGVARVREGEF